MAKSFDLALESDRGAVIVGAALLEAELDDLLNAEFDSRKVSKAIRDRIFSLNGPLSSYSSKILVCRSFSLISEKSFHDLEKIRKLRNDFAHGTFEVDFSEKTLVGRIEELHCVKEAAKGFEGKRYTLNSEPKLPEWEMRSKGYLKCAKAVFCLGVQHLIIDMKAFTIARMRGAGAI
jgi:hypothetical protein